MSFVSLVFLAFFGIFYPLYRLLPHRGQNHLLLAGSLLFYGWWDWRFLFLLIGTSTLDWFVGLKLGEIADDARRKRWLVASLTANLTVLGFFKYFNFFADSFAHALSLAGLHASWTTLHIVLPIGISFYTFQSMSYTIDVYRRHLKPGKDYFEFLTFVSFFPQLVAGPIERAVTLLPRVQSPRRVTWDGFTRGLYLILLGLVKKAAISDGVAGSVDAIYNRAGAVSGADVTVATWLFAIQIYGDFAGYSDIARGLAKLLGFDLITNFDQPYFAVNPSDFWRRWHISLSTWLRDYLYVPLGGNRGSTAKTYRNLMLTMGLGGLWHGAAWNYILWGVYQGGILCAHRLWTGGRKAASRAATWLHQLRFAITVLLFFQVTCYGWLLFRARSFSQITRYTAALFQAPGSLTVPLPTLPAVLGTAVLLGLELLQWRAQDVRFYRSWPAPFRGALYAGLLLLVCMGLGNTSTQFIYFQF